MFTHKPEVMTGITACGTALPNGVFIGLTFTAFGRKARGMLAGTTDLLLGFILLFFK